MSAHRFPMNSTHRAIIRALSRGGSVRGHLHWAELLELTTAGYLRARRDSAGAMHLLVTEAGRGALLQQEGGTVDVQEG